MPGRLGGLRGDADYVATPPPSPGSELEPGGLGFAARVVAASFAFGVAGVACAAHVGADECEVGSVADADDVVAGL